MKRIRVLIALAILALAPGGGANCAHATLHIADLIPRSAKFPGVYSYPTPTLQHRLRMYLYCPDNLWIIVGKCESPIGSDCDSLCVVLNGMNYSIRP